MREHGKSRDRQEDRLEVRREAEDHKVQETIEEARLAAANAPILAEIAAIEAELAGGRDKAAEDELVKQLLDAEYEWQWDREEELGFLRAQAGDELDDPRTDDDYYEDDLDDIMFLG